MKKDLLVRFSILGLIFIFSSIIISIPFAKGDLVLEENKLNNIKNINSLNNNEDINKERISSINFKNYSTFAEKISSNMDHFNKEYPNREIVGIRWESIPENPSSVCYVIEGLENNNKTTLKYLVGLDENNEESFIRKLGEESRELYEIERKEDGSSVQKEVQIDNYISFEQIFTIVENNNDLEEYYIHSLDLIQYEDAAIIRLFLITDKNINKNITLNAETGEIIYQ